MGIFIESAQFILKPKKGPKVKVTLSEVNLNEKFVVYCKLLGASMHNLHALEETPDGLRITNTITVKGLLSALWVNLVAKGVANSVPKHMDALVDLAKLS